jgi:hypothetical protein
MKNTWLLCLLLIPGVLAGGIAKADQGKFRAAFSSCAEKLGLPAPTQGERPELTQDQRTQLKACLADAGVTWNHHHHHHHHHHGNVAGANPDFRVRMAACFSEDGVTPFSRGSGQAPTDAQKAELKKCRAQVASAQ